MAKIFNIKYGASRTVFLTTKYAIKRPSFQSYRLFLHGLLANLQEVKFSKSKLDGLCPVIFYLPLGLLVVMPRCRVLTFDEFDPKKLEEFIDKENYRIPAELKPDSFGYLNGKLVAIDYG